MQTWTQKIEKSPTASKKEGPERQRAEQWRKARKWAHYTCQVDLTCGIKQNHGKASISVNREWENPCLLTWSGDNKNELILKPRIREGLELDLCYTPGIRNHAASTNSPPARILYPLKLSFKSEGIVQTFSG